MLLRTVYWHSGEVHGLAALCPACKWEHEFTKETWKFDGNFAGPTFWPSMLFNKDGYYDPLPRCHSFLSEGRWQFLPDSTHELAGQTVDMIPIEPNRSIFDYVQEVSESV